MVLMIKTEPVQHTVKWEIKRWKREERKRVDEEGGQRNQNRATRARAC